MKTIKELKVQMEKADSATTRHELQKIMANRAVKLEQEVDNLMQLDNFEAGFHAGWMHRHCDTDADEGTTAEDAYGEFLSCRD